MKHLSCRLAILLMTFVIGSASAVFFHANFSADEQPLDLHLRIIVSGRVVDVAGRPLSWAKVQARLGLDLDGPPVMTNANGEFVAAAQSDSLSKGCPSLSVSATGYAEQWIYFDCWDKGARQFERTIVLSPSPK
jgi:hypothetical protein